MFLSLSPLKLLNLLPSLGLFAVANLTLVSSVLVKIGSQAELRGLTFFCRAKDFIRSKTLLQAIRKSAWERKGADRSLNHRKRFSQSLHLIRHRIIQPQDTKPQEMGLHFLKLLVFLNQNVWGFPLSSLPENYYCAVILGFELTASLFFNCTSLSLSL